MDECLEVNKVSVLKQNERKNNCGNADISGGTMTKKRAYLENT